ncbi:uridine diphosphate glucose pyrophosphatase NUDT14-like [Amphiura filiformis]|uniref:uridine diphosphate glucose pyrophosphatase NUDT14-like n=1 Tax=Amphiura filiformis TaxID=82378 RepID=UPI003B21DFDA
MTDKITEVQVCECVSSKYVETRRLRYKQNSIEKTWDYIVSHDSICILIFNVTREVFVLVRQFRPALYANLAQAKTVGETVDTTIHPGHLGMTYELCAGLVDKDKSLPEMARDEVLEECGYDVPVEKFEMITCARGGVGLTGSNQTYFYAEVTDAMKVSAGGGLVEEGEMIEVYELTLTSAPALMWDETKNKPVGVIFAFMWFFQNKRPGLLPGTGAQL